MTEAWFEPEEIIDNLQYALVKLADHCQELEEDNRNLMLMTQRLVASVPKKSNDKVNDPDTVSAIRREWKRGLHTQREIADMYNLNPATVSRIVRGIYYPEY